MSKIRKNYRFDTDVINAIDLLISYYSKEMGLKLSETDVISLLIRKDLKRLAGDDKQLNLF